MKTDIVHIELMITHNETSTIRQIQNGLKRALTQNREANNTDDFGVIRSEVTFISSAKATVS